MEGWLSTIISGVIGGALTALAAVATLRQQIKNQDRRLQSLERDLNELDEKYVTRREFKTLMGTIKADIHRITETVGTIRDYLMRRERGDGAL